MAASKKAAAPTPVISAEAEVPSAWQSRIESMEMVDPTILVPHKDNPKPPASEAQREMLAEMIKTVGWLKPIVASARTRRVLNGHLRRDIAIAARMTEVPVLWLDVSEIEELELLATLDPIRDMATAHPERLRSLLNDLGKLTPNIETFRPITPQAVQSGPLGGSLPVIHLTFEDAEALSLYRRFAVHLMSTYPQMPNAGSRIVAWLRDNNHI